MFLCEGLDHARLQAVLGEAPRRGRDHSLVFGQQALKAQSVFPIIPCQLSHPFFLLVTCKTYRAL